MKPKRPRLPADGVNTGGEIIADKDEAGKTTMPRTYTIEDIAKLFDKLAEYDPHEWWPPIAIRNPEELERAVEGARTCLAATALTGVHLDNPR